MMQIHKGTLDPETGWMVTPQEAYTPEEWEEHAKTCAMCGDEFVLYTPGDDEIRHGRSSMYCGEACRQEAHRRDSREYNQRRRAERQQS
jgi:ferredoxin